MIDAMSVQMLTHIGVCVSDMERSRAFYCDVLGFEEVGDLNVNGEPTDTLLDLKEVELFATYLERDGFRIELLTFASPGHIGSTEARAMNQLGFTHFSLRVADLDAICAAIERAGGRILQHTRRDMGPARVVMAVDPDGIRLELIERPGDPAALPGSA
jgi:catechol 2,3-dioxygenase-like lactoylglutathione lyase family enzyme